MPQSTKTEMSKGGEAKINLMLKKNSIICKNNVVMNQ